MAAGTREGFRKYILPSCKHYHEQEPGHQMSGS